MDLGDRLHARAGDHDRQAAELRQLAHDLAELIGRAEAMLGDAPEMPATAPQEPASEREAEPAPEHQPPEPDPAPERPRVSKGMAALLRRLHRQRPDLHERVTAGELKPYAAARLAGWPEGKAGGWQRQAAKKKAARDEAAQEGEPARRKSRYRGNPELAAWPPEVEQAQRAVDQIGDRLATEDDAATLEHLRHQERAALTRLDRLKAAAMTSTSLAQPNGPAA